MTAKLHIDVSQGILDVEGDEAFVKSIYDDFKGHLSEPAKRPNLKVIEAPQVLEESEETKTVRRKRTPTRRQSENGKVKLGEYYPKFIRIWIWVGLKNFMQSLNPRTIVKKF